MYDKLKRTDGQGRAIMANLEIFQHLLKVTEENQK
jgi:hypothetical protein